MHIAILTNQASLSETEWEATGFGQRFEHHEFQRISKNMKPCSKNIKINFSPFYKIKTVSKCIWFDCHHHIWRNSFIFVSSLSPIPNHNYNLSCTRVYQEINDFYLVFSLWPLSNNYAFYIKTLVVVCVHMWCVLTTWF